MDTAVTAVSPVVETSLATLQATLAPHAEKVPEVVKAKVTQATEQVVLKASDAGLETTDALLKLMPGEKAVPVKEGVRRLRAEAAAVRKEGAKRNGTEQVAALEDATLVEAVAAILGITWILAMFGITTKAETAKVDAAKVPTKVDAVKVDAAKVPTKVDAVK